MQSYTTICFWKRLNSKSLEVNYSTFAFSATLSVQLLSCELQSVSNWYVLGIRLGLEPYQLNQIEEKTADIERRKIEMYDLWLRATLGASWSHIVTALREMEEITTAERIQRKYGETGTCTARCNVHATLKHSSLAEHVG